MSIPPNKREVELYKLVNQNGETVFKGYQTAEQALEAWDEHENDTTFEEFRKNGMFQRDDLPKDCRITKVEKYTTFI